LIEQSIEIDLTISVIGALLFRGSSTWNSLPDSLRDPELNLDTFKRQISWLMNMQHTLTRAVSKHLYLRSQIKLKSNLAHFSLKI